MNILFLLRPKSKVAYIYDFNTVRQGLEKMKAHGYTAIPVINKQGEYVGTVNEGDFLWHIIGLREMEWKIQEEHCIRDIMRNDWNAPVRISETMDDLLEKVTEQNFVPVVDDRNLFMGIVTRKDVIKYFMEDWQSNHSE